MRCLYPTLSGRCDLGGWSRQGALFCLYPGDGNAPCRGRTRVSGLKLWSLPDGCPLRVQATAVREQVLPDPRESLRPVLSLICGSSSIQRSGVSEGVRDPEKESVPEGHHRIARINRPRISPGTRTTWMKVGPRPRFSCPRPEPCTSSGSRRLGREVPCPPPVDWFPVPPNALLSRQTNVRFSVASAVPSRQGRMMIRKHLLPGSSHPFSSIAS